MKKILIYFVIFVVAYVVINIGMKFYTASTWKKDSKAIDKLISHCTNHTKTQSKNFDSNIEKEARAFILGGKSFSEPKTPEKITYKQCVSKAIYYYTPSEYFSN